MVSEERLEFLKEVKEYMWNKLEDRDDYYLNADIMLGELVSTLYDEDYANNVLNGEFCFCDYARNYFFDHICDIGPELEAMTEGGMTLVTLADNPTGLCVELFFTASSLIMNDMIEEHFHGDFEKKITKQDLKKIRKLLLKN